MILNFQVMPKRTNQPGFSTTDRSPWARGGIRGGIRGRSPYRGRGGFGAIYRPRYVLLFELFDRGYPLLCYVILRTILVRPIIRMVEHLFIFTSSGYFLP